MTMHCPRCGGDVSPPGPDGVVVCSTCGSRLRVHAAETASDVGAAPPARVMSAPSTAARATEAAAPAGRADETREVLAEVRILLQLVLSELKTIRGLQEELKQAHTQPPPAVPESPARTPAAPRQAFAPRETFAPSETFAPGETFAPTDAFAIREPFAPSETSLPDPVFPSAVTPVPAAAPRPRARRRILLIDDEAHSREAAVRALSAAQFTVDTAETANQGLARIGAAKPDLVVLELAIGGELGGEDVITLIKATMDWVDIPIVLHTRVPPDVAEEARATHGADDVVVKDPSSPAALVNSVLSVLGKA